MDDRIAAAWARLPDYLSQHVFLSACALVLGLAISLPLALAASRNATLRWPVLAGASLIQTIPSLALLALFYPLLLALSALTTSWFGTGFSALGFLPALLALTLYSMLPIVRNTVTGIAGVDADVREAARGMGLTQWQILTQVELPLAAPTIMAGIRTATIWVIGTATLSTPVGQTSLGNYIFTGLQTENWAFVLFGCVAAAGLALTADQLLGLMQAGLAQRDRRRVIVGGVALVVGAVVAASPMFVSARETYTIGGKTFSEQFILAQLMADRLEESGMSTRLQTGLGSTVILRALAENEIDVYVEYSGTVWANAMQHTDNPGREEVYEGVRAWLDETYGITLLGGFGFENAYALAMRRDRAEAMGARSIADLTRAAPRMGIGGDFEFFARPEWDAIQRAYGLRFRETRQYQATFMYRAVQSGEVDVISAFSSDGRIARFDLVTLDDPRQAIPPYDAIILLAPARAGDSAFRAALEPLVGAIDIETMRVANEMVDRDEDKQPPRAAARWLDAQIRGQ